MCLQHVQLVSEWKTFSFCPQDLSEGSSFQPLIRPPLASSNLSAAQVGRHADSARALPAEASAFAPRADPFGNSFGGLGDVSTCSLAPFIGPKKTSASGISDTEDFHTRNSPEAWRKEH